MASIFELNYSASTARHLPIYNQDLNRFAGDLVVNRGKLTRLNPNFNTIQYATSDVNSIGNYGTAMVSRRFTNGIAFRGIYTWGKALDILSNAGSLDGGAVTAFSNAGQNSGPIFTNGDYQAQRGRADFDIRQQFSADGTWTVPNSYGSRLERAFLGAGNSVECGCCRQGFRSPCIRARHSIRSLTPLVRSSAILVVITTQTDPTSMCPMCQPSANIYQVSQEKLS